MMLLKILDDDYQGTIPKYDLILIIPFACILFPTSVHKQIISQVMGLYNILIMIPVKLIMVMEILKIQARFYVKIKF